jgi:cation diffusion facilitator family transporter
METSARGIRALKISLVALLITSCIQLAVVVMSGSVALLADTIHNFGDATTSIPLWIAFALAARGASRRFTYGYGKVEDVAGIAIVGVIFFSACVAAYASAMKILHPVPMTHLGAVVFASLVGFVGNEAVAVFRIRTGKAIGSAALVADGLHARIDGFTSLAVLIGVAGTWLGYPIVDPIVGVLITVAILFIVRDTAKSVWSRLIEGIEPEILAEIEHAPMHVAGVVEVHAARARWVGHRVFADLHITVDPAMSVEESHAIVEKVEKSLIEHVPAFGEAIIHVCPEEK